jgi:hypothetical protein
VSYFADIFAYLIISHLHLFTLKHILFQYCKARFHLIDPVVLYVADVVISLPCVPARGVGRSGCPMCLFNRLDRKRAEMIRELKDDKLFKVHLKPHSAYHLIPLLFSMISTATVT